MQVEGIGAYRDNSLTTNVVVRSKEFDRNPLIALESVVWMLMIHGRLIETIREYAERYEGVTDKNGKAPKDLHEFAKNVLLEDEGK